MSLSRFYVFILKSYIYFVSTILALFHIPFLEKERMASKLSLDCGNSPGAELSLQLPETPRIHEKAPGFTQVGCDLGGEESLGAGSALLQG